MPWHAVPCHHTTVLITQWHAMAMYIYAQVLFVKHWSNWAAIMLHLFLLRPPHAWPTWSAVAHFGHAAHSAVLESRGHHAAPSCLNISTSAYCCCVCVRKTKCSLHPLQFALRIIYTSFAVCMAACLHANGSTLLVQHMYT